MNVRQNILTKQISFIHSNQVNIACWLPVLDNPNNDSQYFVIFMFFLWFGLVTGNRSLTHCRIFMNPKGCLMTVNCPVATNCTKTHAQHTYILSQHCISGQLLSECYVIQILCLKRIRNYVKMRKIHATTKHFCAKVIIDSLQLSQRPGLHPKLYIIAQNISGDNNSTI